MAVAVMVTASVSDRLLAAGSAQGTSAAAGPTSGRVLVDTYCVNCHSDRLRTGGLTLQTLDVADVAAGAETWERVIRKLRTGSMPPAGAPRPDAAAVGAFASWLEAEIDHDAALRPHPGRTETLHRVNRMEYHNAVRDLLVLDVDATALVPADDQSYGFDNIAGVLKMSPMLLERYMGAARQISRLAVAVGKIAPTAETFRLRSDLSQYDHQEGLPFGTRGGTSVEYNFPGSGEYAFTIELLDLFGGAQIKEPHQLELSVDGARVHLFTLGPKGKPSAPAATDTYATPDVLEARAVVAAGPHTVMATFVKKTDALAESIREPFTRPHGEGDFLLYQPHIGSVTVSGPFNAGPVQDTPSRRRIFVCQPSSPSDESACAKRIVSTLARRAYRRPVTDPEVRSLLRFYGEARAKRGFAAGIEQVVQALLVSPSFLYRVEYDPATVGSNNVYRLSDIELASRLSFFLWSSIPDDALLDVAVQGRLKEPAVLETQVRRMLSDDRSAALAANFASQWLRLRNISGALPDDVIFPNFSDNLRHDFVTETQLFFQSIVQENRSVIDLLTADSTFLNERLAKFYGVPNVYGSQFRRVALSNPNRYGLLGQGSILTVTSYSDRTSPVGRGKWILENVLGTPPPPPPPNVPALQDNGVNGKLLSMRERMSAHRANPVCASCHARMDPLGFALENFDAIGRWRTRAEGGQPIDASGGFPDGTKFNGPTELRRLLVRNPEHFATVLTERLLVYGLGRGTEYYDAPTIRATVRASAASNYRFASIVMGVVQSVPFQMRSAPSAAAPSQVADAR